MSHYNSKISYNLSLWLSGLVAISASVLLLAGPYYKFAFVPGLFLLLIFLLWKNLHFGFFIILFLIPFNQYTILSMTYRFMTVPKIIGFLTVGIFLLQYLSDRSGTYDIKSNLWPWLLTYFVIGLLSTLMSNFQLASANNLRKLITEYSFFLLTMAFISRKRLLQSLPLAIITSASLSALLSVLGYAVDNPYLMMDTQSQLRRYTGGVGDPNVFAVMLLFAFPLLAHRLFTAKTPLKALFLTSLLGLCITAVILTYSRSGALVMVVTLSFLVLKYFRKIKAKFLGFVVLSLCLSTILLVIFTPGSYWQRQKTITNRKTDFSVGRRWSYLIVAYEKFKEKPIFGAGPGTFKHLYATSRWTLQYHRRDESPARVAHNTYVEVLVGTGIIGLTAFLLIIVCALRNYYLTWKTYRLLGNHEMEDITTAYAISFIVLLFAFLFLTINYLKYFWMAVALSQVCSRISRESEHTTPGNYKTSLLNC